MDVDSAINIFPTDSLQGLALRHINIEIDNAS